VLAAAFGVGRSDVEILGGHTARRKRVRVSGDPGRLQARLHDLLAPTG
jgi:uncharacterized protein YggU (UPF0235/DUF167 family)